MRSRVGWTPPVDAETSCHSVGVAPAHIPMLSIVSRLKGSGARRFGKFIRDHVRPATADIPEGARGARSRPLCARLAGQKGRACGHMP